MNAPSLVLGKECYSEPTGASEVKQWPRSCVQGGCFQQDVCQVFGCSLRGKTGNEGCDIWVEKFAVPGMRDREC